MTSARRAWTKASGVESLDCLDDSGFRSSSISGVYVRGGSSSSCASRPSIRGMSVSISAGRVLAGARLMGAAMGAFSTQQEVGTRYRQDDPSTRTTKAGQRMTIRRKGVKACGALLLLSCACPDPEPAERASGVSQTFYSKLSTAREPHYVQFLARWTDGRLLFDFEFSFVIVNATPNTQAVTTRTRHTRPARS